MVMRWTRGAAVAVPTGPAGVGKAHMMPAWFRKSCLVLPLAVASAGLAACGDSASPTEPTPVTEPEPPAPTADEADIAAARPTANAWLELIDAGRYREAWELGSSYFKRAITADELARTMEAQREPFGTVDSRTFRNATRTDSLPDAPDAPYVVFTHHTVFADGTTTVETVTTERGKRVAHRRPLPLPGRVVTRLAA